MSELVPAQQPAASSGSMLNPLTDPMGGPPLQRLKGFTAQPAVRKALPWFAGMAALGGAALTWAMIAPSPQRVLYTQLEDTDRASVVDALDKASIPYKIDNATGMMTVNEDDLYRARMTVASNGAIATPDGGASSLDNLPIGASRTLEGEKVRSAKEFELQQTIQQIDGVESVRVHIAEGAKSAFVRDNIPPSASVMVRLARGRQLSDSQVSAIVNLVASSIPGLSIDNVKVVDQHGRLLSQRNSPDADRIDLQSRMGEKLNEQVSQLLTPMIGAGNFSTQIQVELDMDEVTSARESYEKQGVLRSETEQKSQSTAPANAIGVPGVLSNTPPPQTQAQPGAPAGTTNQPVPPPSVNDESSATRNYELGREVSVSNAAPGKIKRLSVAIALSSEAMRGGKAGDVDQIKQLVAAAVGADNARGDQVAIMVRKFDKVEAVEPAFYEAPWFGTVLRNGAAVLAVLLVLLLGVRPLIRAIRGEPAAKDAESEASETPEGQEVLADGTTRSLSPLSLNGGIDTAMLSQQVSLAQRMVEEKPESAIIALRQMIRAQQNPEMT